MWFHHSLSVCLSHIVYLSVSLLSLCLIICQSSTLVSFCPPVYLSDIIRWCTTAILYIQHYDAVYTLYCVIINWLWSDVLPSSQNLTQPVSLYGYSCRTQQTVYKCLARTLAQCSPTFFFLCHDIFYIRKSPRCMKSNKFNFLTRWNLGLFSWTGFP